MVLGTFIVSFIGNSFVEGAQEAPIVQSFLPKPTARRQVLVLLYFLMILGVFTLLGVLTIPDIAREGADFVNRLQSDNIWVRHRNLSGMERGRSHRDPFMNTYGPIRACCTRCFPIHEKLNGSYLFPEV